MKQILKLFIFSFLFLNSAFGCALCQMQIPTAKVKIDMNESRGVIYWEFSKEFSDEVILSFDKDGDKKLNESEFRETEKNLLDYLIPKNHLMSILYYKNNHGKAKEINFSVKNSNLKFLNNQLFFKYEIEFNLNILPNDTISIIFHDDENFFNFVIDSINFNSNSHNLVPNINSNILFLSVQKAKVIGENPIKREEIEKNKAQNSSYITYLETNLKELMDKIKINLNDIKENGSIVSLIWLLVFSLLYGVVHALGPGHGKSLVASYFLAKDKSYLKAFSISSLIGVVHTFSAFIFTFIVYFIVDTFLSKLLGDVTLYTSKISAIIIIAIAIYLLYKKIPKLKKNKTIAWSATPHSHSCSCSACNSTSTDLGVIISAGIIPCPGTVTIFIFTLSMGLYFVGFLSAIFMSIGMSIIILLSALISLTIRKRLESKFKNLTIFLEYASLIFILLLGIVLFLAS